MARRVRQLFADTGRTHPSDLTVADIVRWVTGQSTGTTPANNTVRQRMATTRQFLAHCARQGVTVVDPSYDLAQLRKSFPATYGRVQAPSPARWLTHEEAFGSLLDACKDGTWIGSRDNLAIRLGLMGIRAEEACNLTFGALTDGRLTWIGKKNRQRTVTPGPTFLALFAKWTTAYARGLGRPVEGSDPILCAARTNNNAPGATATELRWGHPIGYSTYRRIVLRRAQDAADIGRILPHDLRRTCAAILHNDRTDDGAHRFDLRDIQKVLDHSDPNTTWKYLDLIDNSAKDRAATVLD